MWWILNSLNIPLSLETVCVFTAPIFSANAAWATYLLTKEVEGTGAGLTAAALLAMTLNTGSLFDATLNALAYFYMVCSWGGYTFIINLIPMHVLLCIVTGCYSSRLYIAYAPLVVLGTLLAALVPVVGFNAVMTSKHFASFLEMDSFMILVCTYGCSTTVINAARGLCYSRLVDCLCEKWGELSAGSISLFCKLPGINKCDLENEEEFQNMLLLAKSMGVQHVEVVVDLKSNIGQSSSSGLLRVGVEEDIDALQRFCYHKEKVLLSAPWANGITHVGQRFVGGAQEFRDVLCKYAIQCGFQFTYVKNETTRVTAVCAMREERGCLWAIHCRAQRANGFFYIKRFSDVHSCGTDVRTSKNPRVSSDLVSNTISEIVRDKPLTRPCEVVTILKRDYGLDVSYHVVWLGVEKAKAGIHGDHSLSFDQLRWYSDAVMRYNPGSYVNIDYDVSSQQFCRFFVSFAACISGFNACRPLLFLDGTFLKGKYKGQLLAATAKDGNNGLFPVAFAIVDSETTANWSWFLHELGKVADGKRQITFISDRNLGLLEAMPKVFPSAHHGYCLQHLKSNLRDRMKGIDNGFRDHLVSSLGDCAYEPTVVGFHEKLAKLKEEGKQRAHNFFKDLAPEHWANSYFRGMRYGEMTSNAAESFNNWIKEARNLPITQMVDTIRTQLMRQMSARRDQANKWNEVICPTFETRLMDSFNDSRSWQVSKANEDVFEVHSIPSVTVDVARRTCSCFKWQINGFPCDHAVIAIQKSRYNLNDCVEHYFHIETYRAAYSGAIFPIPSVEKPPFDPTDFTIYPPSVKRPPGRPKKNRIPSRGEKLKQIRCGRCDKLGSHNRKSCTEPI